MSRGPLAWERFVGGADAVEAGRVPSQGGGCHFADGRRLPRTPPSTRRPPNPATSQILPPKPPPPPNPSKPPPPQNLRRPPQPLQTRLSTPAPNPRPRHIHDELAAALGPNHSSLNEQRLFHGTPSRDNIYSIIASGFKVRGPGAPPRGLARFRLANALLLWAARGPREVLAGPFPHLPAPP